MTTLLYHESLVTIFAPILLSLPVCVVGGGEGEGDDGDDRGEGGGVEDGGDERLVEKGLVLQPDHGITSRLCNNIKTIADR